MSDSFIELAPGGNVRKFTFDTEKNQKYKIKQRGIIWVAIDRHTKETVAEFDTEELANNFLYTERNIVELATDLRSLVRILPGFTLSDLNKVIDSSPFVSEFVRNNFHPKEVQGSVVIQPVCRKRDGKLVFEFIHQPGEGTGISISNSVIFEPGKSHEFNHFPILQDLIFAFFTPIEAHVKITRNGLKTPNGELLDPFMYLTAKCDVDNDVLLSHIFDLVERHVVVCDFIRFYSWCNHIHDFHEFGKIPCGQKDEFERNLQFLSIYRHPAWQGNFFDWSPNLHAMGTVEDELVGCGIELSPINQIVDLPVTLEKSISVQGCADSMETDYSLLDILDAIYWEISFFGSPSEAEKVREEISTRVKQISDSTNQSVEFIQEISTKSFSSVDDMVDDLLNDKDD